jgi:hypothetical protein
MKLKDAREFYYFNSGKTSDLIRQLGLAGIAVIWLFKSDVQGAPKIPEALSLPLMLIILGLGLDFLQYAVATSIWGIFQRRKEIQGATAETEFLAPKQFNWPGIVFFVFKVVTIIVAYLLLLRHLARTIL